MKWLSRIWIASLLSAGVALGLSYLFRLDESIEAFRNVKAEVISDSNIVDVMLNSELHLRIQRVEVTPSIVSVVLLANAGTDELSILSDLYELPKYLFDSSTNINQVLIRIMDVSVGTGKSPVLLTAADAKREQWSQDEPGSRSDTEDLRAYLETYARMTYSAQWQNRFQTTKL